MADKSNSECVRVVVRVRPLFGREIENGNHSIVEVDKRIKAVIVTNPKGDGSEPPKQFTFDDVFDKSDSQYRIFETTAQPIVHNVLEGYNGTIFAYGQTGTGKTHTMEGQLQPKEEQGIIPNSFDQIFVDIAALGTSTNFLVRASYLEIYNEEIRDLLAKNPNTRLEMKENVDSGVYVKDLTCFVVKSVPEIRKVLEVGKKNRTVGATLMNQDSSRSHSIYTVTVETSTMGPEGPMIRVGKLNLVDLAGSERQAKTGATGARLKEATKINLSLSALGNVISALVDGRHAHIPYRDSKLTRLLQDSLGGNTKTVMVANIGPADYNFDETISTLRYANRAKNIKNKPKINEDPKDAMLRQYEEEIQRLRAEVERRAREGAAVAAVAAGERQTRQRQPKSERPSDTRLEEIREQMRRDAEEAMKEKTEKARQQAREAAEQAARDSMRQLLDESGQTVQERTALEQQAEQQAKEMKEYLAMLERERAEQEELEKRLREMEAKVLHGEVNLLEVEQEQKAELERQARELADKKRVEEEAARRIIELEEENTLENEQYKSVEEEIELKTRKLKRLFQTYKKVKVDVEDMRAEFQKDKEAMLDDIQALTQQIKLKNLVLDAFVPPSALEAMMALSTWNEHEQCYVIVRFDVAGNAIRKPPETPPVGTTGDVERDLADHGASKQDPRQERLQAFINAENERLQSVYFWYDSPGEGDQPPVRDVADKAGAPKEKKRANPKIDIGRLQDAVPDLDDGPAGVVYPKAQGLSNRR